MKYISPENGAVISLLTEQQRELDAQRRRAVADEEGKLPAIDWLNLERSGREDLTAPKKVEFVWEADGEVLFELAEDADFSRIFCSKTTGAGSIAVGNLRIGQDYYWRLNGGEASHFTTAWDAPRWIWAEGTSNVRDLGGWKIAGQPGRRIRQGMIYRGGEMDTHLAITEDGIRVLREELGIRTDLDLRGEVFGKRFESPLGPDIRFENIPMAAYADFIAQKETCYKVFELLCDESCYPVYFHCWGGADRGGTLALVICALLGAADIDLLVDYELTSLSIWGDRSRSSELFCGFVDALKEYEGETLGKKVVSFLDSCGVDAAMRQKLRAMLTVEE